jgi:hypothetical protein
MAIGDTSRDLQLEDGKGTIAAVPSVRPMCVPNGIMKATGGSEREERGVAEGDEQMSGCQWRVLGFRMSAVHGLRFLRSDRCVCPLEL